MDPPAGGPPKVPLPDPIATSSQTFDLGADPAALERAAEAARTMGGQALSARGTIDGASGQIEGDGAWEGDTADSFQEHRRRLTRDLGVVGDAGNGAAGILLDIAGILRSGQARLDDERDRLARVAATSAPVRSPEPEEPDVSMLTFEPKDPAEQALVSSAVAAAQEIRAYVDEQLATQAGRLRGVLYGTSGPSLRTVSDQWKPRAVRVLDYNIGQGYENEPWPFPGHKDGTESEDIPAAGRVIAGSGANVVTVQEMFRRDAERLLRWLNENAGGGWEMHFEKASEKIQWDDADRLDFGNVVLVRTGGDVGDPTQQPEVKMPDPDEDRVLQHTEVPLK